MTTTDPAPMSEEELAAIRDLWADIRTARTEKTAIGEMVSVEIDLFDGKLSKVFAELSRLRVELATVTVEAGNQCREAAARTVRAETERDALAAELAGYRSAICFETTCTGCARMLDGMAGLEAERNALAARIATVVAMPETEIGPYWNSYDEGRALARNETLREVRAALGETGGTE